MTAKSNMKKKTALLLLILLSFLLSIGLCSYKYLQIIDIKESELEERLNGRGGEITDLKLTGKLNTQDIQYLELLISESDILTCIDLELVQMDMPEKFFAGNLYLKSITLPLTTTHVPANTFSGCTYLKRVKLSKECREIGINAFEQCSSIRSIFLPATLYEIDNFAFKGCINLKIIKCAAIEPPKCTKESLNGIDFDQCELFIPKGSLSKYKNAIGWENFKNITEEKQIYSK